MKNMGIGGLLTFTPHLVVLVLIFDCLVGELWVYKALFLSWPLIALLDSYLSKPRDPPTWTSGLRDRRWSAALWSFVPLQVTLILCGLGLASAPDVTLHKFVIVTVSIGFVSGIFLIPVAHELMHRSSCYERALAVVAMTTFSYAHFCIEHVRGHHRNAATPNDPATAKLGESFYDFYHRSLYGSLVNAWRSEERRLQRVNKRTFTLGNRMLGNAALLAIVYATIGGVYGWRGVTFYVLHSVIGFTLLEIINYVQHYGLVRREIMPDRFEAVTPQHSWSSNHVVSNRLLFGLPRHADHHVDPRILGACLRHSERSPQLPFGYFTIFLLPLIPPLWRRLMDPRVNEWRVLAASMVAPSLHRPTDSPMFDSVGVQHLTSHRGTRTNS